MRLAFLFLFFLCLKTFASEINPPIKRDKYIDEIMLPTIRLKSDINSFLKNGYRAFIIDSTTIINETDIDGISSFLDKHPNDFIAFLQEGENHFNGDYLFSFFLNKMIIVNPQFLPLCDSLLKQEKQILFFSDKEEEPKLSIEDLVSHARTGILFPLKSGEIFQKYKSTNLFTLFSHDNLLKVNRPDSSFINHNLRDAALNFIKHTGKFPNFILTDNPAEIKNLQPSIPFYYKFTVIDEAGNPLGKVRYEHIETLISSGISHVWVDNIKVDSLNIFRESTQIQPVKRGYRFIPEIYTFNYNNYNQFKEIKAQRIDMSIDLKLHMPLSKKKIHHRNYPVKFIDTKTEIINDETMKKVASFDGIESSLYFEAPAIKDNEESFSIALWAKPKSIEDNYPFFTKPGSYCFKIRKGMLCLTIVDLADIESNFSLVRKDEWQHFAVVYEKGKDIRFYLNGVYTGIFPAMDYKTVKSSFTIGSNQWDEYFNGEMSELLFWTRPIGEDEIADLYNNGLILETKSSFLAKYAYHFGGLLLISTVILLLVRRKRKKVSQKELKLPAKEIKFHVEEEKKNNVQFLGEFSIYDDNGNNLVDRLSTKKRSFLVALIYFSIKQEGISPQKLADLFWPGYNSQRAKNVRGTYMQEIRSVISEELLTISYKNKKWKIDFSSEIHCDLIDLFHFQNILKQQLKQKTNHLDIMERYLAIVGKGKFAEGLDNEYMDLVKQKVNDQVLETLEELLTIYTDNNNLNILLGICEAISMHDPVNDNAVRTQIQIFEKQGKTHMAHKCFEQFSRSWNEFFGEELQDNYDDFVHRYN